MKGSSLGLMVCLSVGIFLSLVSNKMFLVWLGLELNMFGIMPYINSNPSHTKNILFLTPQEVKVSFFYFFVQVMGSLLFAWGSILGDWYMISIMGLIIKMGVAPFFWWVPLVMCRLDWLSMGILSTMQKMPAMLLMRLMFDMDFSVGLLLSLLGFLVASMGMKFSSKNLKQLMAWSSISNMSMLLVLMMMKNMLGLMYYAFYSMLMLMFCMSLKSSKSKNLCSSFMKGEKEKSNLMSSGLLLVFSGLPPLISFMLKIYFFSSMLLNDKSLLIMGVDLKGNEMSFFYLLSSFLKSWKIMKIYIIMMMIQSAGYIKAFMSMKSGGYSRLSVMSNSLKNKKKMLLYSLFSMYLLSLMLMWI